MFEFFTQLFLQRTRSLVGVLSLQVVLFSHFSLQGQVSGPIQVIINTHVSYTHSLPSAGAGTSYVWEAESGDIIYGEWDSIVVVWEDLGEYSVFLSLYDSLKYCSEIIDELTVMIVTPVVEYSYDAAGNRIGRQVVYYSGGGKKSKKTRKEIENELLTTTQTMVYPNPTDNMIYLKLSNKMYEADMKQYILYDNQGKMVMRRDITNNGRRLWLSHGRRLG